MLFFSRVLTFYGTSCIKMVLFPRLNNLQAFSMLQSAHWLIFIPPSLYAFFIEARNQTSCDIFTPDTTFPSFSWHAVLSLTYSLHDMATDLMAKAEVSPTAILPIHSKIAAHLSTTYWWTRLTMIRTAHHYSTGWKEAAQPDSAKDFDFTLNMIALRRLPPPRQQTTHH